MTHALIPLEPTLEMLRVGQKEVWEFSQDYAPISDDPKGENEDSAEYVARRVYQAMIAAAPKAPTTAGVNERLLEAAKAFIAKVDDLTPDINGVFQMAATHGAKWHADKNWAQERFALIEAIATDSEGWVDGAEVLTMLDGVAISAASPPQHTGEGACFECGEKLPLREALRSGVTQKTVTGWQPIEAAPKDGSIIVIGRDMGNFGFVRAFGYWANARGISGWVPTGAASSVPGVLGLAAPTHWLPCDPPSESALTQATEGKNV